MLPKVRKALSLAITERMSEEGLNWFTIQKQDIKTNWSCPYGWVTLRRIVKDHNYNFMAIKQTRLLDFFDIPYNYNFGIVTLINESEYEAQ